MPRNKSSTLGREGIVDDTRREFMPGVVENRQETRVSEIQRRSKEAAQTTLHTGSNLPLLTNVTNSVNNRHLQKHKYANIPPNS